MKQKLLNARLNKGLSQEELADLIGMTQSNYSRREKGLKKISELEWTKIAKYLEVEKETICEPDNFENGKVNIESVCRTESFIIPSFVLELIDLLKEKNKILEDKLKSYEN